MTPWEKVYPTIDFEIFQGYPHYLDIKWLNNSPRFVGLPITHIVEFLKYISEIEFEGEDVLVKLFILSLPYFLKDWIEGCCEDKSISGDSTDLFQGPPYSQLCDISKIWDHGALGTSVSDY